MSRRPEDSFCRHAIVLVIALATALAMGALPLAAQEQPTPKVEIFGGYSFYHPGLNVTTTTSGVPNTFSLDNMPSGWGAATSFMLARHIGLTADFGGHYKTFNDLGGLNLHIGTFLFGPRFEFRTSHLTPFAEVLGGLHRIAPQNVGVSANNAGAVAVGGGLDAHLSRHFDIRLVQADYIHATHNFGTFSNGGTLIDLTNAKFNSVRVQAGVNILLAVPPAGPPPSAACSVNPPEVFAGEPVQVTASARDFNPKRKLTYTWTATGGKVTGSDTTGNVDTAGLNPGSYTVTANVSDGKKATAQCNATFTVKERPKHPPQITCSANPTTVQAGTASTITCDCKSPDTDPAYGNVTCSISDWNASGGRISGSGNTATLDTSGAPAGPITVTATGTDSRGLTSTATATVNVEVPPPPPQVSKLNEITFKRNIARVDNTAKAILDDVALRLQRDADSKAVIVGFQDAKERPKNLAAQRAANAKAYLTNEKGIDASRIETRTSTTGGAMKDEIYIVPAGATFNEPNTEVSNVAASKAPYGRPRATTRRRR
ncbi:MAG: OmpA family protein [Acidobacteriaceae bacterium]|nr:OmpA family protein [Acidobacteriaceae bacterium]